MFLLQPALAEDTAPWKIAIIGDTHDSPKRMEGSEGVAVNFIKTLYGEILKHNVDMVVQVGDMADIEGSAPVKGLAKRKELNKILREKASPFMPCAAIMNPFLPGGTIPGTLPAYAEAGRQRAGYQKVELRHPP